jgi:hypothetical protein
LYTHWAGWSRWTVLPVGAVLSRHPTNTSGSFSSGVARQPTNPGLSQDGNRPVELLRRAGDTAACALYGSICGSRIPFGLVGLLLGDYDLLGDLRSSHVAAVHDNERNRSAGEHH